MEQLGESYLYAFGWDVKFCNAIEEFFDEQQTKNFQRSEYPPVILHLMRTFYNEDCSKVTFQLLHYCFFPTSIPAEIHGPKQFWPNFGQQGPILYRRSMTYGLNLSFQDPCFQNESDPN